MFRKIACLVFVTSLVLILYTQETLAGEVIKAVEFNQLMQTVADGWYENNARKAADCFAENAVYADLSPPTFIDINQTDKKFSYGRMANTRAGNPDPFLGLGNVMTARAPTSGT